MTMCCWKQLIQSIVRETDTASYSTPGYVQHFQVDPFGAHLHTETGMSFLVHSLVALYLDATGSIISNSTAKKKRHIIYYCLALPGKGRDDPPLPVCEMLSRDHSIPLMQFLFRLSKYISLQINRIEIDYSWPMIQTVLLVFNKESVPAYLQRSYPICQKQIKWPEIKTKSVLHLCAVHIIKCAFQKRFS